MKEKNLVIVESPTKAKTIEKFLGAPYVVVSSYGHVRDLPKSKLGVDVEHNFEPTYVIPTKARKNVTALKKLAAKATRVILATDEDREGEAIAWHLTEALGLGNPESEVLNPKKSETLQSKGIERIVFHEITERAINEAIANPRSLDVHLVNAQQARRVLDRIVGYSLSPFLWKKVFRGLSAGRVQSVVLRLIVEREEERKRFKPEEYWTIRAMLRPLDSAQDKPFEAALVSVHGEELDKFSIKTEAEAKRLTEQLHRAAYAVTDVKRKLVKRNPSPPFITSTLQQEASRRMRYSATQTMRLAQGLYERGLITYMRTDSVNLSTEALAAAREWITKSLGEKYALAAPRRFAGTSRLAQEAHEAIRPTSPFNTPDGTAFSSPQEKKLYTLIWQRFVACQMPQAEFDATTVLIAAEADDEQYGFKANGNVLKFDGFLKIWPSKISEALLPELQAGEELSLAELLDEQHFTEPPARYNEASLIKLLEEYGIGRPSTYAPTLSLIQNRNYVEKDEQRRFVPTETGTLVNTILTENFPQIVDTGFTAEMEAELDRVAEGKKEWHTLISDFYAPFKETLDKKYEEVEKVQPAGAGETTDEKCAECGKAMIVKWGRFGKFLACSGFPECKTTKKIITEKEALSPCPECKDGVVIRRRTKTRRFFFGCSNYPKCTYATWTKPGAKDKELKTKE